MFQSLVWNIFKMVGNGFELELQLVWVWFGLKLILYMDLITHWFGIRIGHGHGMVWN
jgi:ribosomal protein L6P/L9E